MAKKKVNKENGIVKSNNEVAKVWLTAWEQQSEKVSTGITRGISALMWLVFIAAGVALYLENILGTGFGYIVVGLLLFIITVAKEYKFI